MLKGNKVWTPNGYQAGPVNSLVGNGESIIDYTNGTGTLVTKGKVGVDNQPSSVRRDDNNVIAGNDIDWSNGMKDSPDYVFQLMDGLKETSIKRYMLPDTLGILNPLQVIEYMRKMKKRYPDTHFDFHAHNDYDLAVSNVLAAVLSGVKGLHTTINGLGERAGNAPLASVQAILKDHFNAITNIDESRLNDVSRVVESYSGIVIPANKPIVGENGNNSRNSGS